MIRAAHDRRPIGESGVRGESIRRGPRGEIGFWRFLRYGAVVDLVIAFAILGAEERSVCSAGCGCEPIDGSWQRIVPIG